jgi:hypothetical protein
MIEFGQWKHQPQKNEPYSDLKNPNRSWSRPVSLSTIKLIWSSLSKMSKSIKKSIEKCFRIYTLTFSGSGKHFQASGMRAIDSRIKLARIGSFLKKVSGLKTWQNCPNSSFLYTLYYMPLSDFTETGLTIFLISDLIIKIFGILFP